MAGSDKKINCDVFVIGGGPAGSTAALYLSTYGFDVVLAEKKLFPRETLCGEFLSHEVAKVLKDLNIFEDFLKLNPNSITHFSALDDSGIKLNSNLNFNAFALKRSVLDKFLLDKAIERGVNVLQPAEVLEIKNENEKFISTILAGEEKMQINSSFVIAAYGKQNILDKKLNRSFTSKRSYLNGIKFHLPVELLKKNVKNEIRIFNSDGIYCGINQVSAEEITVCFLENRKNSKISSRERIVELMNTNKFFNDLFIDDLKEFVQTTQIYGTGNIFFGKKSLSENGVLMVGDAARIIAPVAGDGIGMAMESAKILSEILNQFGSSKRNKSLIENQYRKSFDENFNGRLNTAKVIQKILLQNNLRKAGFFIANHFTGLLPNLIKFTREREKIITDY